MGDFYEILGIETQASSAEVKRAYRDIARQYHPDKNPNDSAAEEVFKSAAEAYRVLSDEKLRRQYDRTKKEKEEAAKRAATRRAGDVFEDIFRGKRRETATAKRGHDLRFTLDLRLEEAAFGAKKRVAVPCQVKCVSCGGTGAKPGSSPTICQGCGGSGTILKQQGFFESSGRCDACNGSGRIIPQNCVDCGGSGESSSEKTLEISVPAGVDGKTRLKISGEGSSGGGKGPPGDLFVELRILPHPFLTRDKQDVHVEVPILLSEAVLGAEIDVPSLQGVVKMKIPPGTASGQVFRMKGRGFPSAGQNGDQHVTVLVEIPAASSAEAKEVIRRLREIELSDGSQVRNFREALIELPRRK